MADSYVNDNGVEFAADGDALEALFASLEGDLKESTKKVEEEFVDTITEPHITLSTGRVVDILKVASSISSAGENSFESKVVVFDVVDGCVKFRLSDNKRSVEQEVPILNKDNTFTGFLAFGFSSLSKTIKICGNTFSIIQRTDGEENPTYKYSLVINGGEIHMDNIRMSKDKYSDDYSSSKSSEYLKENLAFAIKSLSSFASTSIKSGKNLDFSGNVVQATPINSIAKITFEESYPSFKISLTDCRILSQLMSSDDADKIAISSDGKVFIGSKFKFKTETFPVTDCVFESVTNRMFSGDYAVVDSKHLSQIAELSCTLDTSLGNLKFNYTDDGNVETELLTKRENSNIVIQGISNQNLVKMENPVEIPANNLKGALSVFQSDSTLNMRVSSDGISLENSNIRVAVLGKGIGK